MGKKKSQYGIESEAEKERGFFYTTRIFNTIKMLSHSTQSELNSRKKGAI